MTVAAPARSGRWLFGPASDLLLGCGLAYALLLGLFVSTGSVVRSWVSIDTAALLVLLIGTPHYGATLLRVYERREDRRAYTLFAVHATILVAGACAAGVHSAWVGSWLLTLYLTWSPWHYTGQNYGIAVMFLRRRAIPVTPELKRPLYASFILSYALSFLAVHGAAGAGSYAPFAPTDTYRLLRLGIPSAVTAVLFPLCAVAYAAAVIGTFSRLLQRGRARDLIPTAALMVTQALWFTVPVVSRHWGWLTGAEPMTTQYSDYYFFWIAMGHAVQYLWITAYYAKASQRSSGNPGFLVKCLLVGAAVWALPGLLFAPDLLGRVSYGAGLGVMVAACVNIHHFILDGAIWKLRDGRVARILLRQTEAAAAPAPGAHGGRPWLRRLVLSVGAASLAAILVAHQEANWTRSASERGDLEAVEASLRRRAWIGRDSAKQRRRLAEERVRLGDLPRAELAYRRSLELDATVATRLGLASVLEQRRADAEAAALYQAIFERDPGHAEALYRSGLLWRRQGELERAREQLFRAVRAAPNRRELHLALRDVDLALAAAEAPD